MDLKTFFDNFETIANAPGGITRLRELILDLAVSGKLLTSSSSDTPVSALLALIKSKHEPHGLMSEPRFLIPDHWEWVAIGTIAEHQLGKMLNKSRTNGVARKYLRTANVASHGGFDLSLVKEMIIPVEELEKYSVRKGDLFVNEGGDVGKCAIWTSDMEDFAFQNHLHRLRPLGRITSRYIQLVLQQARNSGALLEMSAGVTIQNLSANTIRKLACPLAPPAEQERIVAKVDELMSLCDELEEVQNQRHAIRTATRKSAIDAISTASSPEELDVAWKRISGNWLTIADTSESITSLRSLILDLATLGKLGTQVSSEVVDSTQELKDVDELFPSNWKIVTFSDGCNIEGGNQPPKSKFISEPKSGYVRLYQIRDYGNSPVPTFIPEESTNRFSKQGDVLIGRYGASIGKIFRAADGAYNVALAKFIYPEDLFRSEFVYWILRSSRSQSVFRNMTRSAQAGFNKNDLAALKLPCPPLGEQDRIIGQLSSLMGLCDELEESLLRQNALKKKLSGALTREIAA